MTTTPEQLSILVREQLPDYVKDNYDTFIAFPEAYYEYLQQNENAHDVIQNARSYADIDRTIDDFVQYFLAQFAHGIPVNIFNENTTETKRFLVKYVGSLYRAKGTSAALKFLFRLAFDEEIDVIYPYDYLLRPSDGKLIKTAVMRAKIANLDSIASITAKEIVGEQSEIISSIDNAILQSTGYYDLYLTPDDFFGTTDEFIVGEKLVFTDANVSANIWVMSLLSDVEITNAGLGYKTTDTITISAKGPQYFLGSDVNEIYNPSITGLVAGSPGTFPAGWSVGGAGSTGLTRTISSVTLDTGYPAARIRLQGTSTGGNVIVTYGINNDIELENDYTNSIYYILSSGTTANISAFTLNSNVLTSGNTYLTNYSNVIATANTFTQRGINTFNLSANTWPTAAKVTTFFKFTASAGVIDATLDLGGIQFEHGSEATYWKDANVYYAYDASMPTSISAIVKKVDESGQIVDIEVVDTGTGIDETTTITIGAPSDTRDGTYYLAGNVTTVSLNVKHGLSVLDTVNVTSLAGNLVSNTYTVINTGTLKAFKLYTPYQSGNTGSGPVSIRYNNQANLSPVVSTIIKKTSGYGIDTDGQLDTDTLLQDSEKWQQFSYIIRSSLGIDRWENLVKQVLHPAGLALFGEINIFSDILGASAAVSVKPVGDPYDSFILLLQMLINNTATNAKSKQPNSYYQIEIEESPYIIDSTVSRTASGATLSTIERFKFEFGNAFPINTIGSMTINDISSYALRKSNLQPPSYYESPNRGPLDANTVLSMWVNT
jgi:hypothetical protein